MATDIPSQSFADRGRERGESGATRVEFGVKSQKKIGEGGQPTKA